MNDLRARQHLSAHESAKYDHLKSQGEDASRRENPIFLHHLSSSQCQLLLRDLLRLPSLLVQSSFLTHCLPVVECETLSHSPRFVIFTTEQIRLPRCTSICRVKLSSASMKRDIRLKETCMTFGDFAPLHCNYLLSSQPSKHN